MISIYFRETDTLVMSADFSKNRLLKISDISADENSYFNKIMEPDASASSLKSFVEFFSNAQNMGMAKDGVYIILPDYAFRTIDCIETVSEEDLVKRIEDIAGDKIDNLYYVSPIVCHPSQSIQRYTVYAIQRSIIQRIIDVAGEAGLKITSVEPASIAFMRGYGIIQEERILMEVTRKHGILMSYSPIGGFFKLEVPDLPIEKIAKSQDLEKTLAETFNLHDTMANRTFISSNDNIPVIIQSESGGGIIENSKFIQERNTVAEDTFRAYHTPVKFADYIESDIAESYQLDWIINAGTFLQEIPTDKFLDMLQAPGNLRIEFRTANLLPEEIVINSKYWHWKQNVMKLLRAAIILLFALVGIEFSSLFYFSSVVVSDDLVSQYEDAKLESDRIESEFSLIKKAKNAHQNPVEAYMELLAHRPKDCHFVNFKVGSKSSGSIPDKRWVSLEVAAKEPTTIQDFGSSVSSSEMFKGVRLEKLTDQSNTGYKTAEYSMTKGKVGQK